MSATLFRQENRCQSLAALLELIVDKKIVEHPVVLNFIECGAEPTGHRRRVVTCSTCQSRVEFGHAWRQNEDTDRVRSMTLDLSGSLMVHVKYDSGRMGARRFFDLARTCSIQISMHLGPFKKLPSFNQGPEQIVSYKILLPPFLLCGTRATRCVRDAEDEVRNPLHQLPGKCRFAGA